MCSKGETVLLSVLKMFRLRLAFNVTVDDETFVSQQSVVDWFKRDYTLTVDSLTGLLSKDTTSAALIDLFRGLVGPKGKIFKLENQKPQARSNFHFLFKNKLFRDNGFEFRIGSNRPIDDDYDVRFRRLKVFQFTDNSSCKLRFNLERIDKATLDSINTVNNTCLANYKPLTAFDSDDEKDVNEASNSRFYSRNGLLGTSDCAIKRQTAL